nr:peptidylprolyl isomerase [uncultured Flavobacterium sp.]
MNLKSIVYFSLFGLIGINGNAQNPSDELLKINNVPFTVGEFERIYTKNLDLIKDEQQKDINNYLDLFILYKLKVAKAIDLDLDKKTVHINEFNSHRNQFAAQYLTNQETLDKLALEAYERSKFEVKASHIIFLADEFATPADTLKAYNRAIEVRNEILNGKDFAEAAFEYSDDPSSKENKGNLGYFSTLRMVYPFETGAYNTPVGEISMPIRSQFGYHLIKVEDKRLRHGKREVAQIFVEKKDDIVFDVAKKQIDEIYSLLKEGKSFEDLVQQYSEDLTSKSNNGKFANYEPGLIFIENLDEKVYDLQKPGEFSEPFKSQHGWHIVKLVAEEEIPTFDERKQFYIRKVQSDSRSRVIENEIVSELKEKYTYKLNDKNFKSFVKFIEKNVTKADYSEKLRSNKELASFANQKINEKEFVDFIDVKGVNFAVVTPLINGVEYVFNDFVSETILSYYKNNLENEFPEFKYTVQEFKEGLLLFDLLEEEVWKKAKNDTLGYTNFYQTNLNQFKDDEAIVGLIYQSNKKSDLKKIQKIYSKSTVKQSDKISEILEKSEVNYKKGKFEKNNQFLPKGYKLVAGVSDIFEQEGKFYLVVAEEYLPSRILDLEEAKQNVIYQYQQEIEKQWIEDLKQNAVIEINEPVLNQLKTKYNNN